MTYFIRLSEPTDYLRAVSIWHHALDASHQFLAPHHKAIMKVEVAEFLSRKILWLAVDQENHAVGLMILREHQMDALFVGSAVHGVGIGKLLVQHAFRLKHMVATDAYEQNVQALGFYKRLDFKQVRRSPIDGRGRPYPVVHLESSLD